MSKESKIRDAAEVVKGIVEAVPVYQDLAQPAFKELGVALQRVTKLIHIALSPLYALVWGHEKISAYLDETLAEKLKHVPEEKIVPPSPAIAGPTLEALRFAGHEPNLRELYANLLASAMDARTAEEAHPAFVDIVRQLSADEARVLRFIAFSYAPGLMLLYGCVYLSTLSNNDESPSHRITHIGWISESETRQTPSLDIDPSNTLAVASNCEYPHLIQSYLDNLRRLGLLSIQEEAGDTGLSASILRMRDEEYVWGAIRRYAEEMGLTESNEVYFQGTGHIATFTAFGMQFCRACVIEGTHEPEANQ
jgi:Abortive infection alpha